MQHIADWLDKLGMSEYAQRFAENGISVAALRHLTDQDSRGVVASFASENSVMISSHCLLLDSLSWP
jgi:hypothetical protein